MRPQMELPPDRRFRLCETSDGSWQLLRTGEQWVTYLGFDPESRIFVCISFSSGKESRGFGGECAVFQRVEGVAGVRHPAIGKIHEFGETSFGNAYCISEFVEGEPLLEYLKRNSDLSDDLLACILLDLADALGVLAEYPRFLSCVEPNDFLVTLDRGIFPGLCLGRLGLNREDQPASDYQLAERWTRITAGIHMAMREGRDPSQLQNKAREQHPRYEELVKTLNRKSGVDAILHLKELNRAICEVANLCGDPGHSVSVKHRKLCHIKQVPIGPLQKILFGNGELNTLLQENYEIRKEDIRFGVSPFTIPTSSQNDTGGEEKNSGSFHLYLLPPERLFEESFIEPLNRKMFDGYLKSHPNGVRARSLICEKDFTLIVADRIEGLPLPSLQARRSRLSSDDALVIVRQLDRVLGQFESARFPLGRLNPWQIEVYFESIGPDEIPDLIDKTEIQDWPNWDLKLRVEASAETFVEPANSAWSHLIKRFCGRSFPAIFTWLLEGDRFEWALRNGNAFDEPLSWNPYLEKCLQATALEFDDADPSHREYLMAYISEIYDRGIEPSEYSLDDKEGQFFGEVKVNRSAEIEPGSRKMARDGGTVR